MTGEDDSTTWNGDRRKNSKGTQIFSLGKWASGGAVGIKCFTDLKRKTPMAIILYNY